MDTMVWVYLIAMLGLGGIILETFVSWRKASVEQEEDLTRVRAGIRQHETAAEALEARRLEVSAHLAELRSERDEYSSEVEMKRQTFEELLNRWRLHNPGDPFDTDPGHVR